MVPHLVGMPQRTKTEPEINEITDNFLPPVPSQISTMTLGGFFQAWLVFATNQFRFFV
jgi:hypothetical protein